MATVDVQKEVKQLEEKILAAKLPVDLREKALLLTKRLSISLRFGSFSQEYERNLRLGQG